MKTACTHVKELGALGYEGVKFVMDRGFFSRESINRLYQGHHKFIVAVATGLSFVREHIDQVRDSIRDFGSHDAMYWLGMATRTVEWDYSQDRPYKKDVLKGKRRMYLHIYYSVQKAADE